MILWETPFSSRRYEAHAAALGRVTANFATLEDAIEHWAIRLAEPQNTQVGYVITSEMSFRQIVSLVSSLLRLRLTDSPTIERVEILLGRALAIEQQRNALTHSSWGAGDTPSTLTRIKTTAKYAKGFRFQLEQLSAEDIERVASQIMAIASDLTNLLHNVMYGDIAPSDHSGTEAQLTPGARPR